MTGDFKYISVTPLLPLVLPRNVQKGDTLKIEHEDGEWETKIERDGTVEAVIVIRCRTILPVYTDY